MIETLPAKIKRREDHLTGYQNRRLARRYRKLVDEALEALAERVVHFLEHFTRRCRRFCQPLAHADGLRSLTRKYEGEI